jgi:RNA polymerase-binding transcription factor DksA
MTSTELAAWRRQLVALRQRLAGDVASLTEETLNPGQEGAGNLSHVPTHLADLGTDAFERQVSLRLLQSEGHTLAEIDAALGRLGRGAFGRCEGCQQDIPRARLRAMPYTRYCVGCAGRLQDRP